MDAPNNAPTLAGADLPTYDRARVEVTRAPGGALTTWATVQDKDGNPVARVRLGSDPMDLAEHFARLAIEAETNTRMGTSEHRQARKLKAIRKAMGYSYP